MKKPKPELQNIRIIRLAMRLFSLPLVLASAVYAWARRLRQSSKSQAVLQAEDDLRQSRARRTLRGLPADHVQRTSGTID